MKVAKNISNTNNNNLPAIFFQIIGAICAFITAYLVINGQYLEIAYVVDDKDIPIAGSKVWGLHLIFALVTLCLMLCAFVCVLWHKKFGQAIAWWQATLGFVALIIALIAFLPNPFEFQIRNYNDATHMTYIFLSPNSSDGFAGNQNEFMGSAQKITLNVYYNEKENPNENKLFVCIGEHAWWWGKLTIIKNFTPVFESQPTQLKLLQQFCKPITQAEADKRGLSI